MGKAKAGKKTRRKPASVLRARAATAPAPSGSFQIVEGPKPQRVILLPSRRGLSSSSSDTKKFLGSMHSLGAARAVRAVGGPAVKMKVVDSIHEHGAKLVEATAEDLQMLRAAQPGLVVVPERFFQLAAHQFRIEQNARTTAGGVSALRTLTIQVLARASGEPVAGATVVAFSNFAQRIGAMGVTSSKGTLSLKLPSNVAKLQRLYVYPEGGMVWGALKKNVSIASGKLSLQLLPLDLGAPDSLRHFAGAGAMTDGSGVKVGVVDTGVALHHPDLRVVGGECTVSNEKPSAFGPLGGIHGSHCAGIIAGRGSAPTGVRGIAPGVDLFAYRVFPTATPANPEPRASNFSIAKAIDRAVAAGCDLLNLSLGGGDADDATEAAIQDAFEAGTVVIAAAGNDEREPVSFPASFDLSVAVSAVGRKGLFPKGSQFDDDVASPFGKDKKNFVASFSNIGSDLDCTGPGVAVVSTVPENSYAAMSGTSMATPAVTGLAARLLAKNKALLNSARNEQRAHAIVKALLSSAKDLGFGPTFQGQGLPSS
jgi:subtilisin